MGNAESDLNNNDKLSARDKEQILQQNLLQQERIKNHILSNQESYSALWQIVNGIMAVKDDIIRQLDQQESPVKQFIGNDSGGEGYVLASPNGDIKLVPRAYFSKANRAVRR